MRESAPSFVGNGDGVVEGVALSPLPLIRVRWAWLSLLICQVGLMAIILATVIVMACSSEMQAVPKDCSIATLCALDPDLRTKLGPLSDMKGLKQRSRGLKARLERRGGGEEGEAELLLVEATRMGDSVGRNSGEREAKVGLLHR